MTSKTPSQKTIGILGGGQLARMMILKAHELGITVFVLSENKSDPAAQVTQNWMKGNPHSSEDLKKFIQTVDIVTFESEFYDPKKLTQAASANNQLQIKSKNSCQFYPSLKNLGLLQDRASQKQSLEVFNLPTARFMLIKDETSFREACHYFKHKLVLKKRIGGYDGYGTLIIKSKQDEAQILEKVKQLDYFFIAEEFVPFKKELSMIFARTVSGEMSHYPLIESHQEDSKCAWVVGPVQHSQSKNLILKIKKYLKKIDYVGVIAFELFDTSKGLLINEVAPRVHNTGHFSLDATNIDQFTAHLMCLLDLPIPEIKIQNKAFCMTNLVGRSNKDFEIPTTTIGKLHWYGKTQNRPGRKMGHINYIGQNQKELLQLALKERKRILR